jgi:hypothetical protein
MEGRARLIVQVLGVVALIDFSSAENARASPCEDAVAQYDSAIDGIASTLKRYTNCVSGSQGADDCSSEFRRLRSAQSEFESAVASHQSDCQ